VTATRASSRLARSVGLSVTLAVTLAACGDGAPAPTPDAGADAGLVIAPPSPPVLTPCPAGWREVADATGLVTCDPWPATGYRTDCAWDEAHFPGTPGCTRVGTACPADGWPADLPADRVIVYVDDGAAAGGDGASRASAFTTIGAAITAAPSGAIIAVATGLYDEAVSVGAGMTVWGACVSGTRIVTSAPADADAALLFAGDGAGARNLGIDGPQRPGIVAIGMNAISIEAVVVAGARGFGLFLKGGSISGSDLVVRGVRGEPSDGKYGRGITVQGGTEVSLSRVLVDDNQEAGLFVWGAGTSVEATDVVVRGTRGQGLDGTSGDGIHVQTGAHLALSRVLVDDNRYRGLSVLDVGTSVDASDVVVRGTREQESDSRGGRGIFVTRGARLSLARGLLVDNREQGIFAKEVGTSVEASDLVVRGTREQASDGAFGRGADVEGGAHLLLARAVMDDNRATGIAIMGADTSVAANDVVVRGTREQASNGEEGRGLNIQDGAQLTVTRALLEDNQDCGVFVQAAVVEASDLVVRDTNPRLLDGSGGNGVWAQLGSRVVIAGGRVERSHGVGIASLVTSTVELRDVVVSGVEPSHCMPDSCLGEMGGFGLVAIFGGTLVATGFTVEDASLCGVLVGVDGDVPTACDLESGTIDRTAIGACVQLDGFDSTRLQSGVEYRDVGVPLRATSYELPRELPP
jgi:hypothetical protein